MKPFIKSGIMIGADALVLSAHQLTSSDCSAT